MVAGELPPPSSARALQSANMEVATITPATSSQELQVTENGIMLMPIAPSCESTTTEKVVIDDESLRFLGKVKTVTEDEKFEKEHERRFLFP